MSESSMKDHVKRLAQEAGAKFDPAWGLAYNVGTATFERFAALVAEECAKVAESESYMSLSDDHVPTCIRAKFRAPL